MASAMAAHSVVSMAAPLVVSMAQRMAADWADSTADSMAATMVALSSIIFMMPSFFLWLNNQTPQLKKQTFFILQF